MNPDAPDIDDLLVLLDLETIDADIYRGEMSLSTRARVYGGQVAAQALVAAGRTVPDDRPVHSLHSYFMRPGDPTIPIVYDVDRLRDGRSFTTRRVRARQRGKAIFSLEASFQMVEEGGLEHQRAMPDAPAPEGLEEMIPLGDASSRWGELRALDLRAAPAPEANSPASETPSQFWFRPSGPFEGGHLIHAAILTYASDYTLLANVLRRHDRWFSDDEIMLASLDHAMWFHQVPKIDGWTLYEVNSPAAGGSRGLAVGYLWDADGTMICTAVQEGLARVIDPER